MKGIGVKIISKSIQADASGRMSHPEEIVVGPVSIFSMRNYWG
jgi:hypothetical protein